MNETRAHAPMQTWDETLGRDGSVRLDASRGKTLAHLAVSIVLASFGAVLTREGGFIGGYGWFAILFFGLLAVPFLAWRLWTGRPSITVTADDISLGAKVRIPWRDVSEVLTFKPRGGSRIILLRMTQAAAIQSAGWEGPLLRASNRLTKGPDVGVPNGLQADQERLTGWLAAVHARWHARHPTS